ncbi:MAG: HAD family phosphatase [Candidatus Magasanikbacteria bacterium]|nr:HAD family phosphatase [Candidatus Magasanikbacteria bacterium]
MSKKFKAVIFDMDGVLIDSEQYWGAAEEGFLNKYKMTSTEEMSILFTGRSEIQNVSWMKEKFNLPGTIEELITERRSYTDKIYSDRIRPLPLVESLLSKISLIYPQAIASGARQDLINEVVDKFSWRNYFKFLVSSDDVGHIGKPNPAIYLHTADKLGVRPEDCLVFEDAQNGVVSAKNAGMSCVALINQPWTRGDYSLADLQIDSFGDERINELLF